MIRTLKAGEPLPSGVPSRYRNSKGYVRLRWRLDDGSKVEVYEHRAVVGNPAGMQVHHKNGVRDDNRLENLEVVTAREHQSHHMASVRVDDDRVSALYSLGLSQPQVAELMGINPATVCKSLARTGMTARPAGLKTRASDEVMAGLLKRDGEDKNDSPRKSGS